jgi:hypothetical protein
MNASGSPQSPRSETPIVSHVTERGLIVELVYRAVEGRTAFAVGNGDGHWRIVDRLTLPSGEVLVPYSARNNLIRSACVLFPSAPESYGGIEQLVADIRSYLCRYVSLSREVQAIAPWYALFSWVHDAFNEVPYLRFRGEFGTGKTRALIVLGSICYKPVFASAASTSSPIFHTLDAFGGTLVLDEADFRASDERADIVKILNNGSVRGMPVLRTIVTREREFNPRAFSVFGPKLVAMRKDYDDRALESRFITAETGHAPLDPAVPINLPPQQRSEALMLRNKLLAYRLSERNRLAIDPSGDFRAAPRLRQALLPLLSIIADGQERRRVTDAACALYAPPELTLSERLDLQLITVLVDCLAGEELNALSVQTITERFNAVHKGEPFVPVTPRWVGSLLRQRLRLMTRKSNGSYVIPRSEWPKITALAERHAVRLTPPASF